MKQDTEQIRRRSAAQDDRVLLLEKGKRGILNVIFGRTMLITALMVVQVIFLVHAFRSLVPYMPYIYTVLLILDGAVILHLVNKPSNPSIKITWILLVVLLPPVGLALYAFVELDVGHRMLHRRIATLESESAQYMPRQQALRKELARQAPELYNLSGYTWRFGRYPIYDGTAVKYLPSGEASFDAMLQALESAREYIYLEFFIVDEGYMWGRILKVLEEKAAQGVDVRMLYDGTCELFRLPYHYPDMLGKLGIRCKMFSPLRPFISTYYNNRDHRKILVVDGQVAFTGGVNLADEYINRRELFGHWKDVSVRLEGPAVQSFVRMFLDMWNITEREADFSPCTFIPSPLPEATGYVLPYGDSPLDTERVGEMIYMDIINRAQRYVHIMTPYLILDYEMVTALTFAARRGVDVSIILPHIPDKRYAFALARTHYKELIGAGVRIYEYTPGFVHAKVFVSDDDTAVVGTVNLDYRSLYLHFECGVCLKGVSAISDIEADFKQTAAKCQRITQKQLRAIPLGARAAGWLLKVLAPLM